MSLLDSSFFEHLQKKREQLFHNTKKFEEFCQSIMQSSHSNGVVNKNTMLIIENKKNKEKSVFSH